MDMNMKIKRALVTKLKENKHKYTTRDVGKSTVTRKLQNLIGSSTQDLMISVCSHVKNCPVTSADAKLEENIYDLNTAGVQGKTVWKNEPAYEVDQILIIVPSKYIMVTLVAGIFYVKKILFFVSILKHIGFGTTQLIDNGKVETFANSLETVVKEGFKSH